MIKHQIRQHKIKVNGKNILVQQSPSSVTMVEYTPLNGKYIDLAYCPDDMIDLEALKVGITPRTDLNHPSVRIRLYLIASQYYPSVQEGN